MTAAICAMCAVLAVISLPFPVHGHALAVTGRSVIAALDSVAQTMPAQTRRYAIHSPLRPGDEFDAFLDPRHQTLDDVHVVHQGVAGIPAILVPVLKPNDLLPVDRFVTQTGRPFRFSNERGKVVLLTFVYTVCPDVDICPAISGKFAYLQHHLDPRQFHLVEMTIDPARDSPAVLAAYGKRFGADPARWSMITGEQSEVHRVIDAFSLSTLETTPGRIIHGDTLAIIDPQGRIAQLIPTAGWVPDDVIASAENVAGNASNPLRRFELATVAGIIAFCGGSITTGQVVLDSAVFLIGIAILGGLLVWITKRVIIDERF